MLLVAALGIFASIGAGCTKNKSVASLPQVNLTYWTVWNEPDDFQSAITAYHASHPNVTITVRKMNSGDYEQQLVQAWARDEGPDIFSIPNAAVGKYRELISPLPDKLTLPTQVTVRSAFQKRIKVIDQSTAVIKPGEMDTAFVPVVASDVVLNNQIYGLPLATDTLALLYNKDLLNAAKIVAPPRTWQELVDMVDSSKTTLTREENSDIVQSGIALGTAENIARAPDILSLLMMQSGAQMVDSSGATITFQNAGTQSDQTAPGLAALNFYTSFANPARVTYSWNDRQADAQQEFAAGKVAFFIGYKYQLDAIRLQNPSLNVGIAPLPQITAEAPQTDYANYWVETVSRRSKHAADAWNFIVYETTGKTQSGYQVVDYLNKTKKPAALRELITAQKDELDLKYYVDALLVARTWYHGYDYLAMESAMRELIRNVNGGTAPAEALNLAAQKVQLTLIKSK